MLTPVASCVVLFPGVDALVRNAESAAVAPAVSNAESAAVGPAVEKKFTTWADEVEEYDGKIITHSLVHQSSVTTNNHLALRDGVATRS